MIRPHPASSEFARRVVQRNGRLPAHLDETCRVAKCCTPGCRNLAATNDCGSTGPIYCDECWDQHDYLVAWARRHPDLHIFSLKRVWWPATLAIAGVVAAIVALCLIYGVVS